MGIWKRTRTEHCGPKNSGRKSGFYGRRKEAKENSKRLRRDIDKKESVTQLVE